MTGLGGGALPRTFDHLRGWSEKKFVETIFATDFRLPNDGIVGLNRPNLEGRYRDGDRRFLERP